MSEEEWVDYNRTVEELITELKRWRTVAKCRYCLPWRAHWCRVHRDLFETATEEDKP